MPPTVYPAGELRGAPRSHKLIAPDPDGWVGVRRASVALRLP